MKNLRLLILLTALTLAVGSCSDDDSTVAVPGTQPTETRAVLTEEAVVVDDDVLTLTSSADDLEAGLYRYEVTGDAPPIGVGDILVGTADGGYLRRVTDIETSQGPDKALSLSLTTIQAYLDEAFGELVIDKEVVLPPTTITIDNLPNLDPPLTVTWDLPQLEFEGSFHLRMRLNDGTVELCEAVLDWERTLSYGFEAGLQATSTPFERKGTYDDRLPDIDILVPTPAGVAIPIRLEPSIAWALALEAQGQLTLGMDRSVTTTGSTGIRYTPGAGWVPVDNMTESETFSPLEISAQVSASLELSVGPQFSAFVFNLIGPSIGVSGVAKAEITAEVAPGSEPGGWDAEVEARLDARYTFGFSNDAGDLTKRLFKLGLPDLTLTHPLTEPLTLWRAPDHLVVVQGEDQSGLPGEALPRTIIVQAFDSSDPPNPVPYATTTLSWPDIEPAVEPRVLGADADGFVRHDWILRDPPPGDQTLQVDLRNGSGSAVADASAVVLAGVAGIRYIDSVSRVEIDLPSHFSASDIMNGRYVEVDSNGVAHYENLTEAFADGEHSAPDDINVYGSVSAGASWGSTSIQGYASCAGGHFAYTGSDTGGSWHEVQPGLTANMVADTVWEVEFELDATYNGVLEIYGSGGGVGQVLISGPVEVVLQKPASDGHVTEAVSLPSGSYIFRQVLQTPGGVRGGATLHSSLSTDAP